MGTAQKVTLQQVAALAGVSTAAASMILNNRANVSFALETTQRVAEAAKTLGYSKRAPPATAKKPLGNQTILVFSPNVTSPYYAALLQAIEQQARSKGYDTLIYNTYRDTANEKRLLAMAHSCQVAGIIFTMRPNMVELVEQLSRSIPTVVIADRDAALNTDTVETSNYTAGVLLAEHLLELGHQHIAFISTTLDSTNTARTKRLDGISDTYKRLCPQGSVCITSRDITPRQELDSIMLEHTVGYQLCEQLLGNTVATALVGVNDMVAYGIADAVMAAGLAIPGDYSIAGFDNNFPSGFLPIALTTVEHCIEDKGHNAFDILYERMTTGGSAEGATNCITRVEYRQHLVARASTAALVQK